MTRFHLASTGSDTNDGLTPETAWKTMTRLNAAIKAREFRPGDGALFRRGDVFAGVPMVPGHNEVERPWITFGPYGDGPAPVWEMYKYPTAWTNQGGNIWRTSIAADGTYGGWKSDKTDVGFIKVDGVIHGAKKGAPGDLAKQWDFYSGTYAAPGADGFLSVYSVGNPATVADEIAVAPWGVWSETYGDPEYTPASRTAVYGIDIRGTGGTGVAGSAYWAPDFVNVYGCRIREHGGSYIAGFAAGTRQGNGVTPLIGSNDWNVFDNEVSDIFDTAFSLQGDQAWNGYGSSARIHMDHNRIYRCNQTVEFWSGGTNGAGFQDVTFNHNVALYAGESWGHDVRINQDGRGCHVLLYQHQIPLGVEIAYNVFFGALTNYLTVTEGFDPALSIHDNLVFLSPDLPIEFEDERTVEDGAAWAAARGVDAGTTFFSLPDEPMTVDAALRQASAYAGALSAQVAGASTRLRERATDLDHRVALIEAEPVDVVTAGVLMGGEVSSAPNGTIVVNRPALTQAFASTFTGANGAAWPAGWTTEKADWDGLDGVADIQNNAGRLSAHTADWQQAWAHHADTVTDGILRGRVQITAGSSDARFAEIRLRAQGTGFGESLEGVGLQLSPVEGAYLIRTTGGANNTKLAELVGVPIVAAQWYRFAVQVVGGKVSAKVWRETASEPADWHATAAIGATFAGGGISLAVQNGPGQKTTALFDDLVLSRIAPVATVAGVVIDGDVVPLELS